MANYNEIDIAGLQGNMQAEPRVFAHHARELTLGDDPDQGVGVLNFEENTVTPLYVLCFSFFSLPEA